MPDHTTACCYALVPCAGSGTRSGSAGRKQYVRIAGRSMVSHTLRALADVRRIRRTLVAIDAGDDEFDASVKVQDVWVERCGGPTRADTVRRGLAALADHGVKPNDWVLVHDAARCLVRPHWIDKLIDTCQDDPVGGLLATPLADTLKRQASDGRVGATVARADLWQAQTPQMFRLGMLRDALAAAAHSGSDGLSSAGSCVITDEASAIEATGQSPKLVPCGIDNFKVTWAADFALAETLLQARRPPTFR